MSHQVRVRLGQASAPPTRIKEGATRPSLGLLHTPFEHGAVRSIVWHQRVAGGTLCLQMPHQRVGSRSAAYGIYLSLQP